MLFESGGICNVTTNSEIISATVIPTEYGYYSWGSVALVRERTMSEEPPLAGSVMGISAIDDFVTFVHCKMYTMEEAVCLAQEFEKSFITPLKF